MAAILSALMNGAIASVLVAGAVWLGMLVASRFLNAATRYLVWWVVLAVTVGLPAWYLPVRLAPRADGARTQVPLRAPDERQSSGDMTRPPEIGLATETPPANHLHFPIVIAAGRLPRWAGAVWAAVSLLMLVRLAMSWMALRRRKLRASEAPAQLAGHLSLWLTQCGCSRARVRVAVSSEISTPMVAGLRAPSILIPAGLLDSLSEAELDQVGLHETAHLSRHDDGALIVQRFAEALFALHPIVRWIARRIDLEREIACDDFVVQATGSPRPYAACLTRVAELTGGVRGSLVAAAVADERSHLTRRVDMLLNPYRHRETRPLRARLAAIAVSLVAVAWITAHAPAVIAFAMPATTEFAATEPVPEEPAAPAGVTTEEPPPQSPAASQTPPAPAARPANPVVETARVLIHVAVKDPLNRFVTGLDKTNFRLLEDGVEQQIVSLSNQDVPLSLGLLIDTSGSMRSRFAEVQEAVRQLVATVKPEDEFFVVQFNQEAHLAMGFTHDLDELQRRLAQMQPSGGTSLFDAVDLAVRQMREAHNPRKAILVITDTGSDNSSTHTAAVLQTDIPVYALSMEDSNDRPARLLADLAERTGGRHFTAGNAAAMAEAATGIAIEMRNLYVLEYTPTNATRDGAFRKLQVELVTPRGLPPLKAEFRAGYYAPRQ